MIIIFKTSKYERAREKFVKNNPTNGGLLIKTLENFSRNPNYPSLHLEKLSGSGFWTIRIDKGNRIFFYWIEESKALFIDIGKHDKYRKY